MQPKPWSPSSLDTFVNCPRRYYEEQIAKSVPKVDTPELAYGNFVHKKFEERQKYGVSLDHDLSMHEDYMHKLAMLPGTAFVEQEAGLTVGLSTTGFFANDVWMRCKIDYWKRGDDPRFHYIADYKTGKPHSKMRQLGIYALYAFCNGAEFVKTEYYWTQTKTVTPKVWKKAEGAVAAILNELKPDLMQYRQAFKDDVWQPRPSGLCKKHCPVSGCEFHGIGPGRRR